MFDRDDIYDDLEEEEIETLDDLLDEFETEGDLEELLKAMDDEDLYEGMIANKRVSDHNLADALSKLLDDE